MNNVSQLNETQLSALDAIIAVDHSGSMGDPSLRLKGKSRSDEVQECAVAVARLFGKWDTDGITVIGFNNAITVHDGVTAEKVSGLFKELQPYGSTNTAGMIDAAVAKAKESSKQAAVIVYTDGAASDEAAVITALKKAATDLGRGKIGFVFVQVGEDPDATKFLKYVDNELEKQGVPDIAATVTAADAENLSVPQLAWLALNA
jgi:hypothetical protein